MIDASCTLARLIGREILERWKHQIEIKLCLLLTLQYDVSKCGMRLARQSISAFGFTDLY